MKDDRLIAMRVFLAVAETGGFTTAARALNVSQPFVSQTIQRLEDRLGARLLHRTTRGHRLTPAGERFIDGCREAVQAVDAAEAALQEETRQITGELRVSAPLAFGMDRVTPLLPAFLEQHPKLSLDLRLTDESVNLIEDRIDVAIRMGRLGDSTLMHRRLCDLRRIVIAAPALLEVHGHPETPRDLGAMPCLSWDGAHEKLNHWPFLRDGEAHDFHADGRFRSNDGMSLFQMCLAGFGVMRCAEHLARPAIRDGRLVQILEDFTVSDDGAVFAVFLPERNLQPRLRSFIDYMVHNLRAPEW